MSVLMNSVPPVLMKIVPPKKRFNKINNVYFLRSEERRVGKEC